MTLNSQQLAAAHYQGEAQNVLLLAGAGTGKTKTIVARVAYLLKQGVPSSRILLLTFTRRAASEMLQRIESEIGHRAESLVAGTFHYFCLQVMRRIPKSFGVENRSIIDRDDQVSLLQLVRGQLVKKNNKEFPKAKALINYISYARNTQCPLADYLAEFTDCDEAQVLMIEQIAQKYHARKVESGYLDYDDILCLFVQAVTEKPALKKQLQQLFDHILVDEMQDTNPIQWQIIENLLQPAKLFCVGDDAQSIYAFRGADFRNVHEFSQRLSSTEVLKLERNYRSTQDILDVANWLLSCSGIDYDKQLVANREGGTQPQLLDFGSRYEEARWLAGDLVQRFEQGAGWQDHMILIRTAWSGRQLESELIRQQIPYRFIGGTSLLESAHIKDVLSLFRAAINDKDELAWIRYLKCWPRIGDVTAGKVVEGLWQNSGQLDALEVLAKLLPARDELRSPIRLARKLRDQPSLAIKQCVDLLTPLLSDRYERWESRVRDFEVLISMANEYDDLLTFIETYTLDPVSNSEIRSAKTDDAVTLITVHSAKGTEAPVCYLLQAQPGMYPHSRSVGDEDKEEEERRILYVALTRAQDELLLTRSPEDNRHFSSYAGETSYLLEQLPGELVAQQWLGYDLGGGGLDGLTELDF